MTEDLKMITIETFQKKWESQLISLIVGIQNGEFNIPISADDQPDLMNINAYYQHQKGNFWVASCNGRVVGTISLLDIGNNQAALRKMFVHPKFRGKAHGTAEKLLHTLQSWAKEQGIKNIYLGTTDKFKAAHRFYEKNGFSQILKEDLPDAFPVMDVDTRFYRSNME